MWIVIQDRRHGANNHTNSTQRCGTRRSGRPVHACIAISGKSADERRIHPVIVKYNFTLHLLCTQILQLLETLHFNHLGRNTADWGAHSISKGYDVEWHGLSVGQACPSDFFCASFPPWHHAGLKVDSVSTSFPEHPGGLFNSKRCTSRS